MQQQSLTQKVPRRKSETPKPVTVQIESNLRHLQLGFPGCGDVTDKGLAALAKGLPASLSGLRLELSSCLRITDAGVKPLAKKIRELPKKPEITCNLESTSVGNGRQCFRSMFDVEMWQMGGDMEKNFRSA